MLEQEDPDTDPDGWLSFWQKLLLTSVLDDCWRLPVNGLLEHRFDRISRHCPLGYRENVRSDLVAQTKS